MKESPFFSIVIPALNEERHLPGLLRSLRRQSFRPFEVIVSDAVGDDNTVGVAESFTEKFAQKGIPLQVISKRKRNVSLTRNYGATASKGEYIVFFDADNVVASDYLEKLHTYIEHHDYPPFLTTAIEVDNVDVYGRMVKAYINTLGHFGKYVQRPFAPGYNTILRRDIFDETGGFDPTVKIFEDYELTIRLHKKGYHLSFVPDAKIIFSMRRFRKKPMHTFASYAKIISHCIMHGPPRDKSFDYPMGGHVHGER